MYIEEKIEELKKIYVSDDFRVPYTSFKSVIRKIESGFVKRFEGNQFYNTWFENLKHTKEIKIYGKPLDQFFEGLLTQDKNHWLVCSHGDAVNGRHILFDTKMNPALHLITWTDTKRFSVVDKKYGWLVSFKGSGARYEVKICRNPHELPK